MKLKHQYCYICKLKKMKKLVLYIFFVTFFNTSNAQIHEVGVFLGGANYVGDVGKTNYINPNELSYGFIYKWNRSVRHSYRFTYTEGNVKANDLDSDVASRNLRGNSFENNIKELSAGLEFNFFPFDLHDFDMQYTPYVFTGVNYFWSDDLYVVNKIAYTNERVKNFAIPIVLGFKGRISHSFVLAAEVGARYSFTDNLDGSNPQPNNFGSLGFGNLNSNDWYFFSGLTLTYTFGENPCFCPN